MERQPRSGYTTGTCARAAAKAAAYFLLTGSPLESVKVCLGNKTEAEFIPEYGRIPDDISEHRESRADSAGAEQGIWCRIKKDAGDDPDVTNGVWVYAGVYRISEERYRALCHKGSGYQLEEYPGIYLNGGPGIGIVTKEGLACPTRHYAINPVPRREISEEVDLVRRTALWDGYLEICISIPDGVSLAEKTFNPKLGIEGGISVLGTTGIVKPMSEEALIETIRLEIRMKAAAGETVLLLTPGNYGEAFLQQKMGVELGMAVKCSNFIADSAEMAAEEGFKKLLLVGHVGKLVKVTGGVRNTHSRYGDRRMELMEKLVQTVWQDHPPDMSRAEEDSDFLEKIRMANTTEEAVGLLKERELAQQVLTCGAEQVKRQMNLWGRGKLEAEIVMFSSFHGVIGKTGQAEGFLKLWKGEI